MSKLATSFDGFNEFSKGSKGMFKGVNHQKVTAEAYKEAIFRHNLQNETILNNRLHLLGKSSEYSNKVKKFIEFYKSDSDVND